MKLALFLHVIFHLNYGLQQANITIKQVDICFGEIYAVCEASSALRFPYTK